MGTTCVSSCAKSKNDRYQVQLPQDIQNFAPQNLPYCLPKLTLKGSIFDIQLVNYKKRYVSLKFTIKDVISIILPQKQNYPTKPESNLQRKNQIKWRMHQEFSFSLTQYELRTHFLNIQVYGENKVKYTEISVNLFMIVTGAHHHDLQLSQGNQVLGRIMFDFKISQIIEFRFDISSLCVEFDKDLSGQQIDYSFKVMTHNQVIYQDQPDNSKIITDDKLSQNYRQFKTQDECQSPMKIRKDSRAKKMVKMEKKSKIQWTQDQKETVSKVIQFKLETNELKNSFIYLMLWRVNKYAIKIDQKQTLQTNMGQGQVIGFAVIKLNKIIGYQYQQKQITMQDTQLTNQKICFKIQQRIQKISQKIWCESQIVANCQINFKMVNPHYFKQIEACSRTQDGIVNMTFLFRNYGTLDHKIKNQQINKIVKIYERIQHLNQKKDKLQRKNYQQRRKFLDYQQQIQQNFENIAKNLDNTLNQSFAFGSIRHTKQMTEDQKILIGLLSKLYFYIGDGTVHAQICWKIIVSIMKRGELYLQNIGFVQKIQDSQIYQTKIKIALQYLILAIKCSYAYFQGALDKYIQAFKAQCYFKIPQYRDHILYSIQKKYDQDVIQFNLEDLETITSEYSSLLKSRYQNYMMNLDWKKYFYQKIEHFQSYKQTYKLLIEQLQNSDWIKQLSKRQEAFYQFTAEIMKRLNELSSTIKLSKWNYFPGYTKIIRGFLVQMKRKRIMQFSPQMIKASTQLLAHQDLINILMPLVVEKVNGFDKQQLSFSLSLLHMFLDSLTDNRTKAIPRTFNYIFFFKTMKAVFQLDNIDGISKMLIIIYDFYKCISHEWRDNFTMYLMGKVFFKFFFHWSYQVRMLFYNILIIKIYFYRIRKISNLINLNDKDKATIQMNSTIAQRYQNILTVLANAQNQKKNQDKDFSWFQKDLYKRMKKKRQRDQFNRRKLNNNLDKMESNLQNLKKTQRYTIQNLSKDNNQKIKLNKSSFVEQIRSRSRTACEFKPLKSQLNNTTQQNKEQVQVVRGNSFCGDDFMLKSLVDLKHSLSKKQKLSQSDDQPSIQGVLSLSRHLTESSKRANKGNLTVFIPQNKKRNFSFFEPEDHELQDLKSLEIAYILKSLEQYRDDFEGIQKYVFQKGQLPKRNIQMDEFDAKMSQNT